MQLLSLNVPKFIAHRGAKASFDENTLTAFKIAKEQNAEWVELDVMLSKDNVAVVFHDDDLDRMTDGTGRLDEKTFKELQTLKTTNNEKIPSFDETLKLIKELDLGVNVEIKPSKDEKAEETAKEALKIIEKYSFDKNLLVSSFNYESLKTVKALRPDIPLGLLVEEETKNWHEKAVEIKPYSVNFDDDLITDEIIEKIKKLNAKILIYTVNSPERAEELWKKGVSSIFTDDPAKIFEKYIQVYG